MKQVALVIDIQEKLLPAVHESEELLKKTELFLKGLKELEIPVLFTEQYPRGLGATVPEIKSIFPNACYVAKTQFSAWTEEVKDYMNALGATDVLVFGIEAHVCVLQTVETLLKEGYRVTLVRDLVSSRRESDRETGILYLRDLGASISTYEAELFKILKDAKNEHFKVISNLIK